MMMTPNDENHKTDMLKEAALYLAKAENTYLLRGVLDYLWFQKKKFITKSGGANYRLLYKKGPCSVDAFKFMHDDKHALCDYGKHLVKEHAIPHKIVSDRLITNPTSENLDSILDAMNYVVITKEEDKILTERKLKHRMPENWGWNDMWNARYKAVEIELTRL